MPRVAIDGAAVASADAPLPLRADSSRSGRLQAAVGDPARIEQVQPADAAECEPTVGQRAAAPPLNSRSCRPSPIRIRAVAGGAGE